MKTNIGWFLVGAALLVSGCASEPGDLIACAKVTWKGFRKVADERAERFQGKVQEDTARCRGSDEAVKLRSLPWVDWQNYWARGDSATKGQKSCWRFKHLNPNGRGIDAPLLDIEYQRIELLKFNLFDNGGTYKDYVLGREGIEGGACKVWGEMRVHK